MKRQLIVLMLTALTWAAGGIMSAAAQSGTKAEAAANPAIDFEGLPEGPGREAVYFNCTACHSIKQVNQQRMSREEWSKLLDWMVKENNMHPLPPWALKLVLNYLASHFGVDERDWQGLPPGNGREEVFYLCQACHSLAIVKQQGLSASRWDETLTWMVEEQEMPPVDQAYRKKLIEYLSTHFGGNSKKTSKSGSN
jgi:cytochrome c2